MDVALCVCVCECNGWCKKKEKDVVEGEGAANERLMWRSREEDGGCGGEEEGGFLQEGFISLLKGNT